MKNIVSYGKVSWLGARVVDGIEWPVYAVVWKSGVDRWQSAILCNGDHENVTTHPTRREAIEAANRMSTRLGVDSFD